MAVFRYYVTSLFDGSVVGTNDIQKVEEMRNCEEFFVVDAEKGKWLVSDDEELDVKEID